MKVRLVETADQRQEIFCLRYRIYVDEMGRMQKWADHRKRTIQEPLDGTGHLIGVYEPNGRVVGTARLNFSSNSEPEHPGLYDFDRFERLYPGKVVFISKVMLLPAFRHGHAFTELMKFILQDCLARGAEAAVMDCNDHLISRFKDLGFAAYKGKVEHPEYGWVTPMVLLRRDLRRLLPTSPLLQEIVRGTVAA